MKLHLTALLLLISLVATTQNEFKKWYFGRNTGLDFTTNPPTVINHSTMSTFEGSASIADAMGNLLFYTDGMTIWNQQQQVMANGTGLLGNGSTVQSSLIIKQPGNASIYYVFTLDLQGGANGLRYSLVDMQLAAGMGSVTAKNVTVTAPCTEQLTAARHCNGIDVWVITHDFTTNQFKSYLLSAAGLNLVPVVSAVGPAAPTWTPNNTVSGQGTIKISPYGKKLGLTFFNGSNNSELALFDFSSSSGMVSNYLSLTKGANFYGCEFSGDGSKFYAGKRTGEIYQWDICAGNDSLLKYSQLLIGTQASCGQLQIAPDGKIYLVHGVQWLSVINSPDAPGAACNFSAIALSVATGSNGSGLPNFMAGVYKSLPTFSFAAQNCAAVSFTAPSAAFTNCSASGYSVQSQKWYFGQPQLGSLNTSTLSNPVHDFGLPGTYMVKLVYDYTCGADTIYQQVQVPGFSLTVNNMLCSSPAAAVVTASGATGPLNYTWTPSGQTIQNATVSTGAYTLHINDGGSNCTYTKTVQFALSPAMQLSVNPVTSQVCANTAVTFSASGAGGTAPLTYSWVNGAAGPTHTVTESFAGNYYYTVVVTDKNQCSRSATTQVNFLSAPGLSVSSATVCPKTNTVLMVTGALSYTWTPGNFNGDTLTVVSPTVSQTYTVTGQGTNGCLSNATVSLTILNCTSVSENIRNGLHVYPNPFAEELNFDSDNSSEIMIYNFSAELVTHIKLKRGTNKLSLEHLPAGVYFLKTNGGRKMLKLVKL